MFEARRAKPIARLAALALLIGTAVPQALALTADELERMIADGQSMVIIDVRSRAHYGVEHIPGAINIPASVLSRKKLPPFGLVVVYGDGLDVAKTQGALAALEAKPGIQAQMLDGGFLAWATHSRSTTRGRGLFDEFFEQLTYEQLVQADAENVDMVLIDLRSSDASGKMANIDAHVDLQERFPDRRVIVPGSARRYPGARESLEPGEFPKLDRLRPDELYVLIDDGDGRMAEAVARRLKGQGLRRVVILMGGDIALRTKGQPGTLTLTSEGSDN